MFTKEEIGILTARAADAAERIRRSIRHCAGFPYPYLPAGANYDGIWLEHNQDNCFITDLDPEAAWGSMEVFIRFQRPDGQMPACVTGRNMERVCFAQLQTVYPFARCAREIARKVGRPEEDFARIYEAAVRYDRWISLYRAHNASGLVEMYCEFDTGHDGSPRAMEGLAKGPCPEKEAKNMPDLPEMPILAADLSATRYGAMTALEELAGQLGKPQEARQWHDRAEALKEGIFRELFCAEEDYFYDRGRLGWRKYRTEHITRLFLNKVVDQELFDRIYRRYFASETEFFTPYPFPSMSVSDPAFRKELPFNCWGANTQTLTLLRLLLFMDFYRHGKELDLILARFLRAFLLHPENEYSQELNPFTGAPVGESSHYLPAMILLRESCRRFGWI